MFIRNFIFPVAAIILLAGCKSTYFKTGSPTVRYQESPVPLRPDYADASSWAALPEKNDNTDRVPSDTMTVAGTNAAVDVFWIHPTTYTYEPETPFQWNGDIHDAALNRKADESTMLLQASAFNGAGIVYAPRYRQAHIYAFRTPFKEDGQAAIDTAYADVKAAFRYYIEHRNNGKPFIIASHSQGTLHATRLIAELVDGKPLQRQLVAAYLVGMPTSAENFKNIKPCKDASDINCIVSWCTFAHDFIPDGSAYSIAFDREQLIATNPLSWKTDNVPVDRSANKGSVLFKFNRIYSNVCDAEVSNGVLWIHPPKFPGSFLFRKVRNFHIGDYNLFYMNVRENARLRSTVFLSK